MLRAEDRTAGPLRRALQRRAVRVLAAGQLVALLVILARGSGLLQPLELAWYDATLRLHAADSAPSRVVVVAATEEDIDRFGWPLPDGVLAELAERLLAAGADAIAVDIYRDRPVGEGSQRLDALLRREPRIIWAYRLGDVGHRGIPPPAALAGTSRAAFADVVADPGEVVRRGLVAAEDPEDGRVVLSLAAALAARLQRGSLRPEGDDLGFGAGRLRILDAPFGPYALLDAAGYQVLLSYRAAFARRSLGEAMDGALGDLTGRGVVIGMDSLSVRDSFTTPLTTGPARGSPMPGAMIHAHLADQMLRVAAGARGGAAPPPRTAEHVMIWAAATLGAAIPLAGPAVAWGMMAAGAGALSLAAILGGAALAFGAGWLLPAVPAALALLLAGVAAIWLLHGIGHRQRLRLRRSFEHYLDPRIVETIVSAEVPPSLGGEHREITAMFTDIEGFTRLAETMPAPELAALLNGYFEGLGEVVLRHGGLVVDLMGDGMVALFGAPLPQPDHAARAVAAAREADGFATRFGADLAEQGIAFGVTRIGLHTGLALVGNLGMRARLKYSALGDTLNTAARLESLNRWTGTHILVSGETAAQVPGARFRLLGEAALLGRTAPIRVLTPDDGAADAAAEYAAAVAAIGRGDAEEAARRLDALAVRTGEDAALRFHRRRLVAGLCSLEILPGGK